MSQEAPVEISEQSEMFSFVELLKQWVFTLAEICCG